MYFMVIEKFQRAVTADDFNNLQVSLGQLCSDIRLAGQAIICTLHSAEHAHQAVQKLIHTRRYTRSGDPWRIAVSTEQLEASQLVWECDPRQAIISETIYSELRRNNLSQPYLDIYKSPE